MNDETSIRQLSHNAQAALALAHHMNDSGAHRMTIPVEVNSQHYVITISKSRSRKSRVVNHPPVPVSSGPLGTNEKQ